MFWNLNLPCLKRSIERILFFVCFVCALSACSGMYSDMQHELGAELDPVLVDVEEVRNQDGLLVADLRVDIVGVIDPATVILGLSGLSQGSVLVERLWYLSDLARAQGIVSEPFDQASLLKACAPCSVTLSVPSSHISDYRIDLAWGADAEPLGARALASAVAFRASGVTRRKQDCTEGTPCGGDAVALLVEGAIENQASVEIETARAQIVVTAGESGEIGKPFAIVMNQLNLKPGQSRPVRFVVPVAAEQAPSEGAETRLAPLPHVGVRILEASARRYATDLNRHRPAR